jgi:hypothetical protein
MTKFLSCAVVVGLIVASSSSVFAKGPGGNNGGTNASGVSPGHAPSSTLPVMGLHGAAGYAPGQQMLHPTGTVGNTSAPGNGAAVYAPGFLK